MASERERVLDFLNRTGEGLAKMFGSSCETLIHDMSKPGHPILAIYNGRVSGRQVGSTADIYGLNDGNDEVLFTNRDYVDHMVITSTGRHVKSSTFNYIGEGYHYALGINFDYTAIISASNMLVELSHVGSDLQSAIKNDEVTYISDLFDSCIASIGKPIDLMKKADRYGLVSMLYQKKAFSYQKSVSFVADKLKVSRYTIYKYINEIKENE
ncbi:transcriptional regulator [Fusibacter sp. 3D3]|uniref:helix-turn-helix transcriptional regulator n=1 Tax=Fusibacter sp. 3D3 TaxID=1048380 RepID=UPI0008535990|nr:helix-turn-helix transcriptional regulator [Fusibacter sp. 3D3]GAU76266.1 YheO-like PAS domain [Fusibacter sp. 3D3]